MQDADFLAQQLALVAGYKVEEPAVHNRAVLTPEAAFELDRARQCVRNGDLIEARISAERAALRSPDSPDAQALLGALCLENGDPAAAAVHCANAVRLAPHWAEASRLCGEAALASGDVRYAIDHFKRTLILRPDWPAANTRLGEALVKSGDLADGFKRMEARFAARGVASPGPRWDGSSHLWGKSVLIVPEREIGDLIQFVRYADLLKKKGATVYVMCPGDLVGLMQTVPGVEAAFPVGSPPPPTDYRIPLFSLPLAFGTTMGTIPNDVPYLSGDPDLTAAWREHLAKEAPDARLRIGLVWADAGEPSAVPVRSVPLVDLSPLWRVRDVAWFAIQQGPPHAELATTTTPLIDVSEDLTGPGSIVASASAFDLIIGVDTPVTHVSGALGRPTWAMLAAACDWRWLARGETTPWYPTVRCFRQDTPGDWETVARRVAVALSDVLAEG